MKKPRRVKKPKPPGPVYTHIDGQGIRWRMVGGRPVSEIADSIMADLQAKGYPFRIE